MCVFFINKSDYTEGFYLNSNKFQCVGDCANKTCFIVPATESIHRVKRMYVLCRAKRWLTRDVTVLVYSTGPQYWRHGGHRQVFSGYPRAWRRHPVFARVSPMDDAVMIGDDNFFFSGQTFYKWDGVERDLTGPRNTAYVWFWCPAQAVPDVSRDA